MTETPNYNLEGKDPVEIALGNGSRMTIKARTESVPAPGSASIVSQLGTCVEAESYESRRALTILGIIAGAGERSAALIRAEEIARANGLDTLVSYDTDGHEAEMALAGAGYSIHGSPGSSIAFKTLQ